MLLRSRSPKKQQPAITINLKLERKPTTCSAFGLTTLRPSQVRLEPRICRISMPTWRATHLSRSVRKLTASTPATGQATKQTVHSASRSLSAPRHRIYLLQMSSWKPAMHALCQWLSTKFQPRWPSRSTRRTSKKRKYTSRIQFPFDSILEQNFRLSRYNVFLKPDKCTLRSI